LLLDLQRRQSGLLLCRGSSAAEVGAGGVSFSFDNGNRCWCGDWVATATVVATASEEMWWRSIC
jgi:hypothetical protein